MLDLALDAVAAYRLTRLVSKDVITRDARARVIKWAYRERYLPNQPVRDVMIGEEKRYDEPVLRDDMTAKEWEQQAFLDDDPPMLVEFIHCRWCVGMWVAFGVTAARRLAPRWWDPVARALVAASVAALLARLETD